MGFVAPFNNQHYISALERNVHSYLPIKGSLKYNPTENQFLASLQPYSQNNQEQQLFQYSTNMYTTYQMINDVKPYLQGENARQIYGKPLRFVSFT